VTERRRRRKRENIKRLTVKHWSERISGTQGNLGASYRRGSNQNYRVGNKEFKKRRRGLMNSFQCQRCETPHSLTSLDELMNEEWNLSKIFSILQTRKNITNMIHASL
jgi:hypothetical protein